MRNLTCRSALRGMAAAAVMLVLPLTLAGPAASAGETVRVGVLKFGTVNWELDTIIHNKLDEANGVSVEMVPLASNQATTVALQAGEVDVIVSDWLWVSRLRAEGEKYSFVPFSSSVGAIMVPENSPISSLADLKGKKIGVAGGPLDKSWLMIQGLARRDFGLDLASEAEPVFGAPPLLAEKLEQGELDAALNYWHYCARLEAKGYRRLIGANNAAMALGAKGPISAIGFVFKEEWADANQQAVMGFVKASRAAKELLKTSDEEWERLRPNTGAEDDATFHALRDRFREGIPSRPLTEEMEDTAKIYDLLAELGGEKLVGPAKTMAPGTFWPALLDGS